MIENLIMFPEEGGNLIGFLIWPIFILVMMLYGQRFQGFLALNEIGRSLNKLKITRDKAKYTKWYNDNTLDKIFVKLAKKVEKKA